LTGWFVLALALTPTSGCTSDNSGSTKKTIGLYVLTLTNPFFKDGPCFFFRAGLGGPEE
jgi:hypothetical protein